MRIVFASGNRGKFREMKAQLEPAGVELLFGGDMEGPHEIEETGETYADNALIKARAAQAETGLPMAVADDSGLCVDALDGAPGIFSARWAGEHGNDLANNEKLMAQMADVPREARTARFHSSIALVRGDEVLRGDGDCEGFVGFEPRGDGGFGYDPLFLPNDTPGKTMAELTADEKNAISHRFHALEDLASKL